MNTQDGRSEVVVVTGASAGIGRATARAFGEHGASVGLLARNEDGMEGARKEIEAAGGKALVLPTDVADPEQVDAAAERVEEELGPIDIWTNVAMTTIFSPLKDIKPEEFKRATEVTYLGYVYGTMSALQRMLPRDKGTIVQVGSALSYRGIPLQAPYCGAKFGIRGFTDSLRTELMHEGSNVRVTMPQLPGLNTPQFDHCRSKMAYHPQPVPPIYQPEVAADAIYWAAHHKRREMYVGTSTVLTILGNKVAPWIADRYLARTGYQGQQTSEPVEGSYREGNLFEPQSGDPGAHGSFDGQSHASSPQVWATKNRRWLALAGIAVGAALARGIAR
ncbi:MAG: SDR family oxidoreductase [Actinobacteria bacterium]|nr:SDR family oxidoreductase [Actinomycetota bacterium]